MFAVIDDWMAADLTGLAQVVEAEMFVNIRPAVQIIPAGTLVLGLTC